MKNNLHSASRYILPAIIILLVSGLLTYIPNNKVVAKNRFCDIYIINKDNKKIPLKAEIAETGESHTTGLMFRKQLDENTGMLFVFKDEARRGFWMKNTYIPLSLAYIDSHGVIDKIYNMEPLITSVTYPSVKPCKFALEVNRGWFKKNNITNGCKTDFNGCFSK
jgi:uncharacterized membrane protein (UPF0127 family)